MNIPKEKAANHSQGEAAQAIILNPNSIKKIDRVIEALKLTHGLNRFEAEHIGEHALNSTAAIIRQRFSNKLVQQWEIVPTRYSPNGVRVLRYWLVP